MHDGFLEIINGQKDLLNSETQYPYSSGSGTATGKCNTKAPLRQGSGWGQGEQSLPAQGDLG